MKNKNDKISVVKGGEQITYVAEAIFNSNEKNGKIKVSTKAPQSLSGLKYLIADLNSEHIASAIFEANQKDGKIKTEFGDKTYGQLLATIHHAKTDKLNFYAHKKLAKGYMVEFKNGSTIEDHEASWVKACMKNHSKEECFAIILKDSQFNNYIGKPKNEYTHNRLPKKAIIGKDSVHLSSYTPNTGRHLDTIEFKDPTELLKYLNKHEIIAKGSTIKSGVSYLVVYLSPKGRKIIKEFNSKTSAIKFGEKKSQEQGVEDVNLVIFENGKMLREGRFRNGNYNWEFAKGGNAPSEWCYSIGGL